MRRRVPILFVLVFVASSCEDPPPPEETRALTSKVELAAGNVWQVSKEGRERLITGAMLAEEATLSVDEGGRALIRLASGAGTFLRGGTDIAIGGETITLKNGELWVDVPEGEEEMARFKAGDVTVSASDAGLDIKVDGQSVQVYVARGLAVVAAPGGRAEVQSGEKVEVKGTAAFEAAPVAFWEDWTGGMADRTTSAGIGGKASGHLYGIDRSRPGAPPGELQITAQSVRIGIRDGIAHTVVDQRFFNPGGEPLEGWYWFTVPEGASVDRFALEVNGALVEGEMVERKQAAAAYEEAVRKAFDPALLEWVDGRTFRARIYPVPAAGERRVVLSYFELLPLADGVYRYTYPLASAGDVAIQEFSLSVELGDDGKDFDIRTLQDATVEQDHSRIAMRRSGFRPRADFLLELAPKVVEQEPLRVMRYSAGDETADYVMIRYSPEVAWESLKKIPGDVVVVLDTSAGGDDSDRQIRQDAVEAILRALSEGDRFAVMSTDLSPRVVYPKKGLAKATETNVSEAVEKLSEIPSAGATDIGEMFSGALDLLYDADQPAVVYVGDGLATVGETSSEALSNRLRRALGDSRARLFTIAVGADADIPLLERLARIGGGRSFTISQSEQTVQEALHFVGMLKTPTITDLTIDAGQGLDQVFTTRTSKLSKGDEMILVARTHHALPGIIKVTGKLGEIAIKESYSPSIETGRTYGYIPVIWARQYLTRLMGDGLEGNRGRIISLGLNYAMMTPFSSFLVLESDQAYIEQGIRRRDRYRFSENRYQPDEKRDSTNLRGMLLTLPLTATGCARSTDSEERAPVVEAQVQDRPPGAPPEMEAKGDHTPGVVLPESLKVAGDDGEEAEPAMDRRAADPKPKRRRSSAKKSSNGLDDLLAGSVKRGDAKQEMAQIAKRPEIRIEKERSIFDKGICSDASRRSLGHRRMLWRYRLARVTDPSQLYQTFMEAGKRCELDRWQDRKVMLDLIEGRVRTREAVQQLLRDFSQSPRIQKYLRQRILRRALDPEMTAVLIAGTPDWSSISAGLVAITDPMKRLETLRKLAVEHPDDPRGRELLIELLIENGMDKEAIREATKLKRDNLASPRVMEMLCDLQAGAGREAEARRTCSELVEFNADDPAARQRLGDIFLRHGWYEAAYRQYASLVAMINESPIAFLRLAAAAAGMGKVDEALRIERKVASGDGEPGPADPRRFARLHSAVRLARMLAKARAEKNDKMSRSLERSLKQTQIFDTETTIVLLVWEDLQSDLELLPKMGEEAYTVSDHVISQETGLVMIDVGRTPPADLELQVVSRSERLGREVGYSLVTIAWNGKSFTVQEEKNAVTPKADIS